MFVEYEPGQAVVRIKTNIEDPNPAMRDWPAFRINHDIHPKTKDKYKVWPLMNFAVAVDDHEMGITHTVRGKDHVDNSKRQQHIYDALGWKAPVHAYTGRIKFEGVELSKRKIKAAIEHGKYSDWDDIRLATLTALRRRGFQPGAFHKFALDIGLGLNDKHVHVTDFFKSLEAHNRHIVDPVANRYFFVPDPVKISLENAPKKTVKIHLHPDDKSRGVRIIHSSGEIFVPKDDLSKVKEGSVYRLMDYCNFEKEDGSYSFHSDNLETYREKGSGTFQWLPVDETVDVEVLMPDNNFRKGKGELNLLNAKVNDIVQLERFGFCRVDQLSKEKITLWFAHK